MVFCMEAIRTLLLLASFPVPLDFLLATSMLSRDGPAQSISTNLEPPGLFVYYAITVGDKVTLATSEPTSAHNTGQAPVSACTSPALPVQPISPASDRGETPTLISTVTPNGTIIDYSAASSTRRPLTKNPRAAVPIAVPSEPISEASTWSRSGLAHDVSSTSENPEFSVFLKMTTDKANSRSSSPGPPQTEQTVPATPITGMSSPPTLTMNPPSTDRRGIVTRAGKITTVESTTRDKITTPTTKPVTSNPVDTVGFVITKVKLKTTSKDIAVIKHAIVQQMCAVVSWRRPARPIILTSGRRRAALTCRQILDNRRILRP